MNSPEQQEDNSWQAFVYIPQDRWQVLKVNYHLLSFKIQNMRFFYDERHVPFPYRSLDIAGNVIEAKLEMNPARIVGMSLCKRRRRCSWCQDWAW